MSKVLKCNLSILLGGGIKLIAEDGITVPVRALKIGQFKWPKEFREFKEG